MAIIEKRIIINTKNRAPVGIGQIEEAIRQAGLEPVRWAIVDVKENELVILANGTEKAHK